MPGKVTDIDHGWREAEKRVARMALEGIGVKLGIIGAAAQVTHNVPQALDDKKLTNYLVKESARGNTDAADQLIALQQSDASAKLKAIFKPGPTMAELGEIFEFGLGNNPERSWLRGWKSENETLLLKKIKRVAEAVFQGKMSPEQGMNLLGLSSVGGVKKRIQASIAPPLKPATLKRKGANKTTPLIDTAQWIGSISHAVVSASEGQNGEAI